MVQTARRTVSAGDSVPTPVTSQYINGVPPCGGRLIVGRVSTGTWETTVASTRKTLSSRSSRFGTRPQAYVSRIDPRAIRTRQRQSRPALVRNRVCLSYLVHQSSGDGKSENGRVIGRRAGRDTTDPWWGVNGYRSWNHVRARIGIVTRNSGTGNARRHRPYF